MGCTATDLAERWSNRTMSFSIPAIILSIVHSTVFGPSSTAFIQGHTWAFVVERFGSLLMIVLYLGVFWSVFPAFYWHSRRMGERTQCEIDTKLDHGPAENPSSGPGKV